jgi:hypothetical protein
MVPFAILLFSFQHPDLKTSGDSTYIKEQCLSHVAGSVLLKGNNWEINQLSIPDGKVLLAMWRMWEFVISALGVQLLIASIPPFKYRKHVYWGIFMLVIFLPLIRTLIGIHVHSPQELYPLSETLFFFYAAHQSILWVATVLVFIGVQLWSERCFVRMEH